MLTSFSFLNSALEGYRKHKKKLEKYSNWDSAQGGLTAGLASGLLVVALIFFALELLVMFFAINVALKCTRGGAERIVHIVLAVVFTLPYMLINLLFNRCAVNALKGIDNNVPVTEGVKMGFMANKII